MRRLCLDAEIVVGIFKLTSPLKGKSSTLFWRFSLPNLESPSSNSRRPTPFQPRLRGLTRLSRTHSASACRWPKWVLMPSCCLFTLFGQVLGLTIDHRSWKNTDTIALLVPVAPSNSSDVSTGQPAGAVISFVDCPLQSLNNALYNDVLAALVDTTSATVGLHGAANVIADTKIGMIPINGIPFAVQTTIQGIDSFTGHAQVVDPLKAVGSGGDGVNSFTLNFGADVSSASPLWDGVRNGADVSRSSISISASISRPFSPTRRISAP